MERETEREPESKREEVLKLLQPVNADTTAAGNEAEGAGGKAGGDSSKAIVEREASGEKPASDLTPVNVKKRRLQKNFLAAWLEADGDVQAASRVTGTHFNTYYYWLKTDQAFQAQAEQALQKLKLVLEAEAWRRAGGYKRDIVYKGEVTGQYNEYSDNLLMFTLKKLDQSYRDTATQIGIAAHGDIEISFSEPSKQ